MTVEIAYAAQDLLPKMTEASKMDRPGGRQKYNYHISPHSLCKCIVTFTKQIQALQKHNNLQ